MCKRVRTLLRVSSRQQLHDDDIPIQRAEAGQYIAKRPEWVFDKEYMEKAVSAYKNHVEERAVLQEILKDAENREFDVLLTYMSDRIGRQEEYSFYVAALNRLGIEVWTIKDGQLKTEEHIDKLLNYIRFWQNEGESKKTGMRVKDTQKELIKAGKFVGGRAPYGYELVESGIVSSHGRSLKKLEIVKEKAQVVRLIYSLAVYQGMGYEKIAKELNRQEIPAVMADQWRAGTVRSILTNPVYMGYLALNRRVARDGQRRNGLVSLDRKEWVYSEKQLPELVIVPQKLWERAQEIREARKSQIAASRKKAAEEFEICGMVPVSTKGKLALTGLAVCGYCGRHLKNGSYLNRWETKSGEKKTTYTGRYVCPLKCKERFCYSQSFLEGVVFEAVESCLEQIKTVDVLEDLQRMQGRKSQDLEKELERTLKKQKTVRLDIRTLEEKIPGAVRGEYCFSAEKLAFMIREKEQKEKELEEKKRQINEKIQEAREQSGKIKGVTLPDWKEEFRRADIRKKKMLLSSFVEKIDVKDGEIGIRFRICPEDFFIPKTICFGVPEQGL